MENIIKGKVYVLGDNIDTDQIIPAEHLVYSLKEPKEKKLYGKFALSGVPEGEQGLPAGNISFIKKDKTTSEFQIIIGGKNCGGRFVNLKQFNGLLIGGFNGFHVGNNAQQLLIKGQIVFKQGLFITPLALVVDG